MALGVREREREKEASSTRPYVHKTQTLHPITKSTGSDEITCPHSLYSSTRTGQDMRSLGRKREVPGKSSSKRCDDKARVAYTVTAKTDIFIMCVYVHIYVYTSFFKQYMYSCIW